MNRFARILAATALAAIVSAGCGSANRNVRFDDGYNCAAGTKVEVPPATNSTGKTFEEVDVAKALSEELAKALGNEGIYADDLYAGSRLKLPCQVTEYEPGSAFKRWLWPGYGSTVLAVKCELAEAGTDIVVGTADARRTVDAGGAYTIGAWKSIFVSLSEDVAKEIKTKLPK